MTSSVNLPEDLRIEVGSIVTKELGRLKGRDLSFRIRYKTYKVDEVLSGASKFLEADLAVFGQMLCVGTYVNENIDLGLRVMKFLAKISDLASYQLSFIYHLIGQKDKESLIIDRLIKKNFSPALRRKAILTSWNSSGERNDENYIGWLKRASRAGNVRARMTLVMFFLRNGNALQKFSALITLPVVYSIYLSILVFDNLDIRIM